MLGRSFILIVGVNWTHNFLKIEKVPRAKSPELQVITPTVLVIGSK